MKLDVYLDLGNIAGYLALPGLQELQEASGVQLSFFPLEGIVPRPLRPEPSQNPDDPLAEYKHLRWQARHKFEYEELVRDCQRMGLDIELASKNYSSEVVHAAALFVADVNTEQASQFYRAVYERRFQQGEALEQLDSVHQCLSELGYDGASFAGQFDHWRATYETHKAAYLEIGIHDSPAFVLADETFQGRQHFPLINWRISEQIAPGEAGAPPV